MSIVTAALAQAGIMRKTHYKFVKEGENDVKTEDSEKTEEGKAGENASQGTSEAYVAQREKA